ncbi:hypothetical protein Gotri_000144, partial [Gossypium trilobum]|nr:hypothetical protein [Gossypium trilobum]
MQNQEQGKENMFDITFDNDTDELNIPILKVGDSTEPMLRNYMAYEQLFAWEGPNFFVDYVVFMDKLIKGYGVTTPEDFYCKDIADQVNKHCKRKRNILREKLK